MNVRSLIILSRRPLTATTRQRSPTTTRLRFFPLALPFATTSSGPTLYQKITMSAQQIVDTALAPKDGKKQIVIFSKSYCPYCAKAKAQIQGFTKSLSQSERDQLEVEILELDLRDDGDAIQNYLETKTKQRTVPNIFIGQKHIGGSSDLAPYTNDKIKQALFAI
ncbi:glutaredoxin Grx1 [Rhizoctonia solani 123E]|uniref:Glutaredoxin Grx1 n=1 Tax=Rhizoctonia solani 123E TaxID=1423351 RepID=A0A074RQJ3_9AGAM|nr:glutaredoxin Grx1 [Rhizoctonia solani 123E]